MSEPSDTVDEFEIRRILNAANAMHRDPRTSKKLREQLHGLIVSLVADCSEGDRRGIGWMVSTVAQTAFAIGALAGTPAMVTHLKDGKRSAGGDARARKRRTDADAWREHATELMQAVRAETVRAGSPHLSQEGLADEVRQRWKLEGEAPGLSALVKHIRTIEGPRRAKVPDRASKIRTERA